MVKYYQNLWVNTQKYVRIAIYFQLLAVSYDLHFKQNMLKKKHMENCYVSYFKVILFSRNLSLIKSDNIREEEFGKIAGEAGELLFTTLSNE